MKLLLHACCGPCSIMPYEILKEAGHEITIAYMNSNIHPEEEYRRRGETLHTWAQQREIEVIEGPYDPASWEKALAACATHDGLERKDRCRACYRLRLEQAAKCASDQGYEGLSTTLAVSPYQFSDIIHQELERACALTGLEPVFKDFRPFYQQATQKSRDLGMYRQNYCGCHYSDGEAAAEREERKRASKAEKEAKKLAQREADMLAQGEADRLAQREVDKPAQKEATSHNQKAYTASENQ